MANLFSGITDFLSGGQMSDALGKLANSSKQITDIDIPELGDLIPNLKLQVMQGTMTPAQAQAAFTKVVGSMEPSTAEAVMNKVVGQMTPAQAKAFMQSSSMMGGVESDQGSLQGQRAALSQLSDISKNQGLTEADRAQFAAVMNQQNANAAQQRAAQIQQLQMQGNAGTGAELAARLSGVQGASNANAAAGADVAKAAQSRALQAIQAGLAGNANLNSQMFDQAAKKAQAQDAVNQFNAQAQNTIGLSNAQMQQAANQQNYLTANQVAMANQAAQQAANEANAARAQQAGLTNYQTANQVAMSNTAAQNAVNLANAQRAQEANAANFGTANTIAGTNVGIQNQQAMMPYNAAVAQSGLELNKGVAGSTADYRAGSVMADLAGKQMSNTIGGVTALLNNPLAQGAMTGVGKAVGEIPWGSIGSGVAGAAKDLASGAGSWWDSAVSTVGDWFSDEDLKTGKRELTDDEVDNIMASMTGYKYRYKGPKTNPTQVGVMAQDMPESSVVDTPAGKMVQKPEALSQALAVIANQHQRIKKLEGK